MSPPIDPRDTSALSREESKALARLAQAGNRAARARLIASCERLAARWAYRFSRLAPHLLEDLAMEARLAVVESVDKFEPDRPGASSFATYVPWLIRNRLRAAIQSWSTTVNTPITRGKMVDRKRAHVISTTTTNGDGEEFEIEFPVESEMADPIFRKRALAVSYVLSDRERDVLESMYGRDETQAAIADRLGLTRQRVDQIHTKALGRLRTAMRLRLRQGDVEVSVPDVSSRLAEAAEMATRRNAREIRRARKRRRATA